MFGFLADTLIVLASGIALSILATHFLLGTMTFYVLLLVATILTAFLLGVCVHICWISMARSPRYLRIFVASILIAGCLNRSFESAQLVIYGLYPPRSGVVNIEDPLQFIVRVSLLAFALPFLLRYYGENDRP